MAPITGWCILRSARITSWKDLEGALADDGRVSPAMLGIEPGFSMSAPEQNPSPRP